MANYSGDVNHGHLLDLLLTGEGEIVRKIEILLNPFFFYDFTGRISSQFPRFRNTAIEKPFQSANSKPANTFHIPPEYFSSIKSTIFSIIRSSISKRSICGAPNLFRCLLSIS